MKAKVILASALVLISCVPALAVQRLPLIEDFTNDLCPPCDAIEDSMDAIFTQLIADGKAAPIRPHVWWPSNTDPMFLGDQADVTARRTYYGFNGVPDFQIDGTIRQEGIFGSPPYAAFYAQMRSNFDARYATPAAISITIQDVYRHDPDSTVYCNFTVSYDEAVEAIGASQNVYMSVVETNHNYPTRGGKSWHIFRGFSEETGSAGALINLANVGDSQSFQWTFKYNDPPNGNDPGSEENATKLNVVIWVQKVAPLWTGRAVLNSAYAPVVTATTDVAGPAPIGRFELSQNVPNPFNTPTSIRYSLDKTSPVKLSVFDPSGRLVRELVNGSQPEGSHEAVWNGLDRSGKPVSSGIYYYRLEGATQTQTRKMTFIR